MYAFEWAANRDTTDRLPASTPITIGMSPNAPRRPPPASALCCAACRQKDPYTTSRTASGASTACVTRSAVTTALSGRQRRNPSTTSQISPGMTTGMVKKPRNVAAGSRITATRTCATPSEHSNMRTRSFKFSFPCGSFSPVPSHLDGE